jgi:hypothetical protein
VFAAVMVGALVVLVLAFVVSTGTLVWVGLAVGISVGVVIAATSGDADGAGNRDSPPR